MRNDAVISRSLAEIRVGDTACCARTVTEADVMLFAMLSGDFAPQHVSRTFGESMSYHSRIAHGMLTVGLTGPVLARLCGDTSETVFQKVHFSSPVLLEDTVYTKGTVTAVDPEQGLVTVEIVCARGSVLEKIEAGTAEKSDRPYISAVFSQRVGQ
jgi:3-hydroxybutyryl-CoA dehydratase